MTKSPHQSRPLAGWDAALLGLGVGQAALAVYVAAYGPARPVPLHFGPDGLADRWGSRFEMVGSLAVMAAVSLVVGLVLHRLALRDDSRAGRRTRTLTGVALVVVMIPLTVLMAAAGLGRLDGGTEQISAIRITLAIVWLVIVILGAGLGKLAPNRLAGVRTYWTRHSRLAWDKANRLLGRIYLIGGVAGLVTAAFSETRQSAALLIAVTLGGALLAVLESWRVWRADPERNR